MIEAFRDFIALYLDRGMDVASRAWLDGYTEGKRAAANEMTTSYGLGWRKLSETPR
jgi:hypothetical protein